MVRAWSKINSLKYQKIVCSISGGSDSDVMLDIVWRCDKDNKVTCVWFDTGLEYQATKDHLKYLEKGYWVTNVKIDDKYNKSVLMIHQVIAEIKYGEYESSNSIPDHLSRDTNDNRKCNIILKSNQRNSHNRGLSKVNTSGKTGVSYNKEKNMWIAYITVNYKTKYLGDYTDFNDAVNVRKEAEKKYGFTCDDIVADYDKEVI